MLRLCPPAGGRCVVGRHSRDRGGLRRSIGDYEPTFFMSGTMALAAAVRESLARSSADASELEVLLPAYGCPDLLAAVRYAGAKPVFVDLEHEAPWMQLEDLWRKISGRTVAIVGVDLFGIRERWEELGEVASAAGAMLIQDAAQAFPSSPAASAELRGERVVLSFGRGKPVSLLHGGAVLAKGGHMSLADAGGLSSGHAVTPLKLHALAWIYNLLRAPWLFWWVSRIPQLHVGRTVYEPLEQIEIADPVIESYVDSAAAYYWSSDMSAQRMLQEGLAEFSGDIVDLATACGTAPTTRLTRLPLQCASTELRDELMERCRQSGYFATAMYERPLPSWDGLSEMQIAREYPNAARFAERLLTLPAHEGLHDGDVRKLLSVLRRAVDESAGSSAMTGMKGRTLGC